MKNTVYLTLVILALGASTSSFAARKGKPQLSYQAAKKLCKNENPRLSKKELKDCISAKRRSE